MLKPGHENVLKVSGHSEVGIGSTSVGFVVTEIVAET